MCGLAGAVGLGDRPADAAAVGRATRALAHRGPDEERIFRSPGDRAVLGHRRLSIIDVAGGHQPVGSEDGSVVAMVNGEIYNHLELRAGLEARGHRFATRSDGETLVHLYEEEGEGAVRRLRGMFAFALWDEPRRRLLLGRDRLGKKPLVWGERAGQLVFASELNALRAGFGKGEVDRLALQAYLALGVVPAPLTIEDCYRKLPPASLLILDPGRPPRIERYWELRSTPKLTVSRREALEMLGAKLDEAVRLRLMSEVPLGLFLSGGVDSSAVLASFARVATGPIKTFSIGFEDPEFDESAHAAAAARAVGAEHHALVARPEHLADLHAVLGQYGEPFADSSCLPTWVLARLAREQVTVALTGDGGDELFAGYPRYRTLLRLQRISGLLPAGPARALGRALPDAGPLRRVGRFFELAGLDAPGRERELVGVFGSRRLTRLLVEPRLSPDPGEVVVRAAWERSDGGLLDRLLGMELRGYLPDDLLVKMDIATMAHGLEARSPLLDHELVELCYRLPQEWKLSGGRSKALLKDLAAGSFPPGFLERPKRGFALPLKRWIRGDVAGVFAAELRQGALSRSGLVRQAEVERLLAEEAAGRANHQHRIFALVALSLFLGARGGD